VSEPVVCSQDKAIEVGKPKGVLTEIDPFELPYKFFPRFLVLLAVRIFLFIAVLSIWTVFWGDQSSVEVFQPVRSDPVPALLGSSFLSSYLIETLIRVAIRAPFEPLEDLEHPLLLLIRARRILGDGFPDGSCVKRF
jgi:hypothetical protein